MLDTNVWLGRLLRPSSVPAQVVAHAIVHDTVLVSEALVAELAEVLARPKFAAYVGAEDARAFLQALGGVTAEVALTAHIEVCRDPDDDHILSLAVSGAADAEALCWGVGEIVELRGRTAPTQLARPVRQQVPDETREPAAGDIAG